MPPTDAGSGEAVALYWDFENLHASLIDQRYGQGAYDASRFRPQETVLDVEAVVEYVLSIGPIAINRAFANWISFRHYRHALLHSAVELIQVFSPGANAKNGADIKLCLDAMDDMARFPHVGTIVVVGGDSDYMPLSYKVKATGRTLVGIGGRGTTNKHWARSCHTFMYYEALKARENLRPEPLAVDARDDDDDDEATLVGVPPLEASPAAEGARTLNEPIRAQPMAPLAHRARSDDTGFVRAPQFRQRPAGPPTGLYNGPHSGLGTHSPAALPLGNAPAPAPEIPQAGGPSVDEWRELLDGAAQTERHRAEARELVQRAIARMAQRRGEPWVQKAGLRPFMQRMDPTFHEANCGFDSFGELLDSLDDLVEIRRGEFDHELRLLQGATGAPPAPAAPSAMAPTEPPAGPSLDADQAQGASGAH